MYTSQLKASGYARWRKDIKESMDAVRLRLGDYKGYLREHHEGKRTLSRNDYNYLFTERGRDLSRILHLINQAKCNHRMVGSQRNHKVCSKCGLQWITPEVAPSFSTSSSRMSSTMATYVTYASNATYRY